MRSSTASYLSWSRQTSGQVLRTERCGMRIYLHPGTQLYAPGDAYSCIRRGRYMRFHPRLIVWREEGCTGIGREGIISLKKFNKSVFITDLFVILHQIRERSEQTAHRYMPALRKEPFREGDDLHRPLCHK
jgi:hypothetical protein